MTAVAMADPGRTAFPAGLHILVAEDDSAMRDLIVTTLAKDGARVSQVDNGLSLIDRLRAASREDQRPDLVVCDVRMPGMNGLTALATMRMGGFMMPVILITAFGDRDLHDSARRMGAVAVFDKPFDLDDLRTAVAHFARHGATPHAG